MKKYLYLLISIFVLAVAASAQLSLPMESQRQEITQTVGDTRIAVVYHRPNAKGRPLWGCETKDFVPKGNNLYPCLVPNNQVWRTGANENTTFEVSNEVKINGQTLPAGKYGLFTIPNKDEWIVVFSKTNTDWGSFSYKPENDQLRVTVKPQTGEMAETMSIGFENVKQTSAEVVVRWEKVRVPFTVDIGDMNARVLNYIRESLKTAKPDDFRSPVQGANYVYNNKLTANYAEAIGWLDAMLQKKETVGALALKANLLADSGKKPEAIATAEKALALAKTVTPAPNTSALEKKLAEWKGQK
ncbi:MAG: DUF2911 domain-containing protein [Acidobacteria bacterium]|nr:DUF2911 domain-containing protein [Acidobacteriota bacterium]